jgi:hypothetical protein
MRTIHLKESNPEIQREFLRFFYNIPFTQVKTLLHENIKFVFSSLPNGISGGRSRVPAFPADSPQ